MKSSAATSWNGPTVLEPSRLTEPESAAGAAGAAGAAVAGAEGAGAAGSSSDPHAARDEGGGCQDGSGSGEAFAW